jgi:2-amino-4-hydroxy-6-hydroxymethyldihydropteridine diphosphokinase
MRRARCGSQAGEMREIAFLALGSNLGDRTAYLSQAREAIGRLPRTRLLAASRTEETAPLGSATTHPFLNQMVVIETELTPRELLGAIHEIEEAAGRTREVHWGSRTLDVDIVEYGSHRVDEADLQVPHPQLPNRPFWHRELDELRQVL